MRLQRGTAEYRVLVELAGQGRRMTIKQLFEATGLAPETLHEVTEVTRDLWYADYVERKYDFGNAGAPPMLAVTWEGQEALRRLDAEQTVVARRRPLWQRVLRRVFEMED